MWSDFLRILNFNNQCHGIHDVWQFPKCISLKSKRLKNSKSTCKVSAKISRIQINLDSIFTNKYLILLRCDVVATRHAERSLVVPFIAAGEMFYWMKARCRIIIYIELLYKCWLWLSGATLALLVKDSLLPCDWCGVTDSDWLVVDFLA